MTNLGPRSGGCLCGAVRYVATSLPSNLHACHCGNCRRISGSVMLSLHVANGAMQIEGVESIVVYTSSEWATRSFCGRCGAGLWYRLMAADADYIIAAGTLDDLTGLVLTTEIYVDGKPDGYAFAGDHPRLTGAEFEATLNAGSE